MYIYKFFCLFVFSDLGPMVYGICFCPVSKKEELKDLKVAGNPFYLCIFLRRLENAVVAEMDGRRKYGGGGHGCYVR